MTDPFTVSKEQKPVLPIIGEGPYGFEHVNVSAQSRDSNSLLNWMERMIFPKDVIEAPEASFRFQLALVLLFVILGPWSVYTSYVRL